MSTESVLTNTVATTSKTSLNLSLAKTAPFVLGAVGAVAAGGTIVAAALIAGVIILTSLPTPPIPGIDTYITGKNSEYRLNVLDNDRDPRNLDLFLKNVSLPVDGTVEIQGSYILYRSGLFSGNMLLNYTVSNGNSEAVGMVNITQENIRPEAKDATYILPKNARDYKIDLSSLVTDVDNETLHIHAVFPRHGSVRWQDLMLYYTARPEFRGTDIVPYIVTDGEDRANATLTLRIENDSPQAVADILRVRKDFLYDIDVLSNDKDSNNDALRLADVFNVCNDANIFPELAECPSCIRFIPTRSPRLLTSGCAFQYTVSDGISTSTSYAHITLYNMAPTIGARTVVVPKQAVSRIQLYPKDEDTFDELTLTTTGGRIITQEVGREVLPYMNGTDVREKVYYSYFLEYEAGTADTDVAVTVSDGIDSTSATIRILINNTVPTCTSYQVGCKVGATCIWDVLTQASDADGDVLALQSQHATDGKIRYTPTVPGLVGLEYQVADPMVASSSCVLTVNATVPPTENNLPYCNRTGSITRYRGGPTLGTVSLLSELEVGDADGDKVYLSVESTVTTDLWEIPARNPGTYNITVVPNDGSNGLACRLELIVPNRPPIVSNQAIHLPKRSIARTEHLVANITDADGDTVGIVGITTTCPGTVSTSGHTVSWAIPAGYAGACQIGVTGRDLWGAEDMGTLSISVTSDPPVAKDDLYEVEQTQTASIVVTSLLANDTDINGDALAFDSAWFGAHGCDCPGCCDPTMGTTPTLSGDGTTISFTPTREKCGVMKFQYRVTDGSGGDVGLVTVKSINCYCQKPMDIVLVWDGSGSISSSEWRDMREFGRGFASRLQLGDSKVRLGLVQFSSSIYTSGSYGFGFQNSNTQADEKLRNLRQRGGATNTRYGLSGAYQMMQSTGRLGVDHLYILITDGDSTRPTSCTDCSSIVLPYADGQQWCTERVRNVTGDPTLDCGSCGTYPRACVDPVPAGNILNAGSKLIALGVGDGLSTQGKEDLKGMNNDGTLLSVSWDDIDTIFGKIVDISCT